MIDHEEKTDPSITLPPITASAQRPKLPDLGILNNYLADADVTEILVNDTRNVIIEKKGKMLLTPVKFQTIEELNRVVRTITDVSGGIVSIDQPYLDTSLPDGSRVHISAPPLVQKGACIAIRKFPAKGFSLQDLLDQKMLSPSMAQFLAACVKGRLNIIISGGTSSGKTTLLKALCEYIPQSERVITIEDTRELSLTHPNSVSFLSKPKSPSSAAISARQLVANSLRMRPDRVIVGECRRDEALDMLQAMNTGHDGSLTSIHANSPRDALSRIETLSLMGSGDIPILALRKQIVSAIDLVIQVKRFRDGVRRVTEISEITGLETETITMLDIFEYDVEKNSFGGTGFVPTFFEKLAINGVELPTQFFDRLG